MTDYMNKKHINNRSVNEIKNELKSIGVELLDYSESTVNQAIMPGGVVTMATTTYPSDVTIQSYSAKRTGDSFYRLYTQVTHDQTLYDCGSLDLLTVEWDPDYFTLYDYSTISYSPSGDGNFISLMDDAKGVLVFTVEDKRMYSPDYVCGIAYVTKQKAGTSKFRGKYIHTYNDKSINWSIGGNLNYSQKDGWNGGLTITIKPDTKTTTWEKESLNWITVK